MSEPRKPSLSEGDQNLPRAHEENAKQISVHCHAHDRVGIEELIYFQGNLKRLTKENRDRLQKSILKHGFIAPVFVWKNNGESKILDGHQRVATLRYMIEQGYYIPAIPVDYIEAETEADAREKLLHITSQYGEFDLDELQQWAEDLDDDITESVRLVDEAIDMLFLPDADEEEDPTVSDDEIPEEVEQVTQSGDVWQLNDHRLICGDSTDRQNYEDLLGGNTAALVFTDPPYGMKKESDGVLNDNLNYSKLLEFNKLWIALAFEYLDPVGSFYCWGIDEPLMDIYSEIIKPMIGRQEATFRNLITWDKGSGQGQLSEDFRMYPIADEKCIFVMKGVQGFNTNADNYYEGWEPIRKYIDDEIKRAGWTMKQVADFFGFHPRMADHWRSKSQFTLIRKEQYEELQRRANGGGFGKDYAAFRKEYEEIKNEYDERKAEYYATRAYFDNTHDNQNNVWHFERTGNNEREHTGGHATPKPLALCERGIKSSSKEGDVVADFFLGSGSTLIAAEKLGRTCFGLELDPGYCDVIVNRFRNWMDANGREYVIKLNGEVYNAER